MALAIWYSGQTTIELATEEPSADAGLRAVKPNPGVSVSVLRRVSAPIAPINNSLACVVVAVAPEEGAVLLPVPA